MSAKTITCKIEIGYLKDDLSDVTDILEFEGNAIECVSFINQQYCIYKLRSFMKKEVVFSVNDGEWKTLEMLKEDGIVL